MIREAKAVILVVVVIFTVYFVICLIAYNEHVSKIHYEPHYIDAPKTQEVFVRDFKDHNCKEINSRLFSIDRPDDYGKWDYYGDMFEEAQRHKSAVC